MLKPLTVWITTNCGKFLKRWDNTSSDLSPEKLYAGQEATVRIRHGATGWLKLGKEYVKYVNYVKVYIVTLVF